MATDLIDWAFLPLVSCAIWGGIKQLRVLLTHLHERTPGPVRLYWAWSGQFSTIGNLETTTAEEKLPPQAAEGLAEKSLGVSTGVELPGGLLGNWGWILGLALQGPSQTTEIDANHQDFLKAEPHIFLLMFALRILTVLPGLEPPTMLHFDHSSPLCSPVEQVAIWGSYGRDEAQAPDLSFANA